MNAIAHTDGVSVFQSPVAETVKRIGHLRNNTGNKRETVSLKSLALLVLERNRQRNKDETKRQDAVSSSLTDAAVSELADYAEWYEERAAIYEFDGGYSHSEAEWLAMNDMLRQYGAAHDLPLGGDTLHRFMCVLHMATGFNPQHKGA